MEGELGLATGIPARLTAAQGRKFGLTVGGAFLVIGLLLAWRHREAARNVMLGLGAAFSLAGLLVPTMLGPVERAWMGLAHLLSKITTPIFMGVVYFVILTPIGALLALFGKTPLKMKKSTDGYWVARDRDQASDMARQF